MLVPYGYGVVSLIVELNVILSPSLSIETLSEPSPVILTQTVGTNV